MKFILSFKILISESLKNGSASYKAPSDVLSIAKANGYQEYPIKVDYRYGKIYRLLNSLYQLIKFSYKIPAGSIVIYQYPEIHPFLMLLGLSLSRRWYRITVIHDINSIRNTGHMALFEVKLLKEHDVLIVHTTSMQNYLVNKKNISSPRYFSLDAFPYLAKIDRRNRNNSCSICFPGNIDKSLFIPLLLKENPNVQIELYGNKVKTDIAMYDNAHYHGIFSPDDVCGLLGSWGLVWDGDSIDSCSGNLGVYHSIIAPHKFSLFLVAGLPLIVWKNSAMAEMVKNKKLGLCLDNLRNLREVLSSIDESEYQEYRANILQYADMVISKGENLQDILGNI